MAPRREPALMMVRHMASHTSMNETGPEASAPTPATGAPLGRKLEEVIADAAALLQGQRRFAQGGKNSVHRIGDGAHHKAVEQGDAAPGAGARQDASGGKEFVARQRVGEFLGARDPLVGRFGLRQRQRHARPAVGHVAVHRRAVRRLQPVLHVPDRMGNGLMGGLAHGLKKIILVGPAPQL